MNIYKVTIHLLSPFMSPTSPEYCWDAYNMTTIKIAKMFHSRGHKVWFYGDSNSYQHVECDKHVSILNTCEYDQIKKLTNNFTDLTYRTSGYNNNEANSRFDNLRRQVIGPVLNKKLETNYQSGNIVLHMFDYTYLLTPGKNMTHVLASSMGGGDFLVNTCFISKNWRDHVNGKIKVNSLGQKQDHEYVKDYQAKVKNETIVYPWFDPDEYYLPETNINFKEKNTFLYLARVLPLKGILLFLEISKRLPNYNFIIYGECFSYDAEKKILQVDRKTASGEYNDTFIDLHDYANLTYCGLADHKEKVRLLHRVTALIQPTQYQEPLGYNAIESMLCGTPVLASNFGAYTETIKHGVTGFLCNTPDEYVTAIENISQISPHNCIKHVLKNFNESRSYQSYIKFFNKIR